MSAVMGNPHHSWKLVPLKDLGQWSGGGTPSKSKPEYWTEGSIPWVSPKDMKTTRIADSADHITTAAVSHSPATLIAPGSVLVVTRSGILSHTLPVAVTDVPVTVNQDLKALTPHQGVLPEYIAWALRCFSRDILKTCSKQGTTVASLETGALQRFEIPLAPLEEQRSIVAEIGKQFSRLDEAVANLNRVKAKLDRYLSATLADAFAGRWAGNQSDWEAAPLRSVAEIQLGQQRAPVHAADANQIPYIRAANITWQGLDLTDVKSMGFPNAARYRLAYGDVLLAEASGSASEVGKPAMWRGELPGACYQKTLIRIRCRPERLHFEFAYYFFLFACLTGQFARLAPGVGILHLTAERMLDWPTPAPPLMIQRQVVTELDRRLSIVRETENEVHAALTRADALRQAILTKSFLVTRLERI